MESKPPLKLDKKQFKYIYRTVEIFTESGNKKKTNKNCPIRFCSKRKRFQGFSRENEKGKCDRKYLSGFSRVFKMQKTYIVERGICGGKCEIGEGKWGG